MTLTVINGGKSLTPGEVQTIRRRKTPTAANYGQKARFAYLFLRDNERETFIKVIDDMYSRAMARYERTAAQGGA